MQHTSDTSKIDESLTSDSSEEFQLTSTCVGPRTAHNTLLLSAGRPPWYDATGNLNQAFIIGICGGSASGKTTVARTIIKSLKVPWVLILSLDSFYKDLSPEAIAAASKGLYNFDSPDALDFDLAVKTLRDLKQGKMVQVPIYDFKLHKRINKTSTVYGANVVIFEGFLTFQDQRLLDLMDLKIFVDTDCDTRLIRRIHRDVLERGRTVPDIVPQYLKYVKPCFDKLIKPTMTVSDLVISWNNTNTPAVNLIVDHIKRELQKRGFLFRSALLNTEPDSKEATKNVYLLPQTKEVSYMQTVVRNVNCRRDDFIFYSLRLMRLVCSSAISMFPYKDCVVKTHSGGEYIGKSFDPSTVAGVSIMRAGESFEDALIDVCENVRIGKILIQTSHSTGEPELYYSNLPKSIGHCYVLLMDATIASGAAALMAIRVLLDHGVDEGNIIITTLILTKYGSHTITSVFPRVRIVAVACDPKLSDKFHILPGIGNFGNRYFGTTSTDN